MYYWSIFLFVIALAFSKLSVIFFLRRLSGSNRNHVRVFDAVAVLVTVWMIGAIFAVTLQCDLAHPWIVIGEHCSGAVCLPPQIDCTSGMLTLDVGAVPAMANNFRCRHCY